MTARPRALAAARVLALAFAVAGCEAGSRIDRARIAIQFLNGKVALKTFSSDPDAVQQ